MEVSLTPEVETELAAIARKTGRTVEQLAAEALRKGSRKNANTWQP
jgi:hypothetical protein